MVSNLWLHQFFGYEGICTLLSLSFDRSLLPVFRWYGDFRYH